MTKITVKDMMCMHCETKIRTALEENNIEAKIDLQTKTVEVEDEKVSLAKEVIQSLGYKL